MFALFNGDNSDSDEELKINTDYAKNYNNWRQKEELNKLKTKYGDSNEGTDSDESSNSDNSSEKEEGNELRQQFDKDFYKALALLKNKDPKIYDQHVTFFDDTNKAQEVYTENKKQKPKKEKAVFLRDYERNIIVERDGKLSDSEDENVLETDIENNKITYVQEQKELKESFKNVLHDEEEEDDDLLKPKVKSESEKAKEDTDYKEWLKGQKTDINESEQEILKPLRDFWSNPNLDANEKFLRDYVLNDKYFDKNYTGLDDDDDDDDNDQGKNYVIHDSDENLSEDEKNIEKQEEFEHKYNFRFEEPDQEFIKRYPRTMENSLRRKDTRRAEKRAEVKKRKEEEKLRKKEELMQLKALKRKEIEEKIEKLKEITGNDDIQFNDVDLEGDFDPVEYDRKMNQVFNDDYYAVPEENVKPEFHDIDEELGIEDNWDNYDPTAKNFADEDKYEGPHCEDPEFNMDADYNPLKRVQEEIESSKKRKRRRKSKFAELIAKEKPKFDPQQYKSYEEYFDKYYSLDYEDMIGDIPCRFKYRKVVPNNYGLNIEEILMADDKELNKWCSLKKALQYKPEHAELNDIKMYEQKAKNEELKRKIFTSLYKESEDEEEGDKREITKTTSTSNGSTEGRKKRRRKKTKTQNILDDSSATEINHETFKDNKQLNESSKKIKSKDNVAQKESKKPEKRKQEEELEQLKKKIKNNNLESSTNSIENKPCEEKEATNKSIKESSKKKVNGQSRNELNIKHSKREKFNEKNTKKKFDKKKKNDLKNKEINSDIASLDPERLKVYGINPKKLKNKLKYGKKKL